MKRVRGTVHRYKNVTSSNCSIFHQWFLACPLKDLQAAAEASLVIESSTHQRIARRATVCITPVRNDCARTAAAAKICAPVHELARGNAPLTWNFCYATGIPLDCPASACSGRNTACRSFKNRWPSSVSSPSPGPRLLQEALALRFRDRRRDPRERYAGARFEIVLAEVVGQPQHIQHVLERQVRSLDLEAIAHSIALPLAAGTRAAA